MDGSNPLYKARGWAQVMVYRILPNEMLSKIYYKILIHEKLNLKNPSEQAIIYKIFSEVKL